MPKVGHGSDMCPRDSAQPLSPIRRESRDNKVENDVDTRDNAGSPDSRGVLETAAATGATGKDGVESGARAARRMGEDVVDTRCRAPC